MKTPFVYPVRNQDSRSLRFGGRFLVGTARLKYLLFLVLFAALLFVSAQRAAAATLTVTNGSDSGAGSLRQAILDAASGDTINFSLPANSSTITLTSAELLIDKSLTITGPGAGLLTVQRSTAGGTPDFRIFNITFGNFNVTISGLTLANGSATGSDGGGIINGSNGGTLTMTSCTISGNATDGNGGGIMNESNGGTLAITGCTISGNVAGGNGGGVFTDFGTVGATNTSISSNSASDGGGIYNNFGTVSTTNSTLSSNSASNGGGIFNSDASLNMTSSTLSANSATGSGGGLDNHNSSSNVTNCTVSGNSADDGGGILSDDGGTINVINCTFSANSATLAGGIDTSQGDELDLTNTIIAGNTDTSGSPNGVGSFSTEGYNLIGDATGMDITPTTGDQIGTAASPIDPLLGALQNNGGPTFTQALLFGSPAIDQGAAANDPSTGDPITTDERGMTRPVDRPKIPNATGGNGSDIGAFEVQTPSLLLNISTRLNVLTGDNVLIGGFIITGTEPKTVAIRAIGPSLANSNPPVTGTLADPVLELHEPDGTVVTNNDWMSNNATDKATIVANGLDKYNNLPISNLESVIIATLPPVNPSVAGSGEYTAIVSGNGGGTGVGLVEVYDLDQAADSQLANISTRGLVQTDNNVMIGGFIVGGGGGGGATVLVRAIGPSLTGQGVTGALADPTLDLYDVNGTVIASNDNWKDTQEAEIIATGIPPTGDLESAIEDFLLPGNYTAIVRGVNNATGVALVEVYNLE
ncbi:MAG: choice-of-anchor Q domain-containing protein [Chthoniobacterales bacterium]